LLKNELTIVFIILFLIISVIPDVIGETPSFRNMINIDDEIDDIGWFTSLALDKNGTPHISYYDYTNGDLKYCYLKENSWEIQTIDSNGNTGRYTSLVLDSNENPHISYYDYTNGDLKYAFFNDVWNIETIDFLGNVGLYTSIEIDSNNHPHISYCNYDTRTLKYASFNGNTWKKTVVDNTAIICADNYFCDYISLELDDNDSPHISYCDYENFDLKYAHLTGNTWQKEIVDSDGEVGVYSSIVLDINGNPHISYADFTYPHFDLKYAQKNNDGWQVEIIDKEGDVRKWTSLALDSNQMPHISYYDYTEGALKYCFFNEDNWEKEPVEVNGSTGCFNSIYLSSDDTPHISYYDWGNKALKFASKNENMWIIESIEKDTNKDFIDQKQTYCSGYASGILDDEPMAQSFNPQYSVLTRVELMLVKRYNPGDFTVSIRENLNSEDLATVHVSSTDIPEDIAWKTFDFPDISVDCNTTYYIVCTSEDTEEFNMYFWYFGHNNPYPSGNAWIFDHDEWEIFEISSFPQLDFGFKTFGLNTSIPDIPTIAGPTSGKINVEHNYTFFSDDADDEELWYEIEWSSSEKDIMGPFPSGETVTTTHAWSIKGDYIIRVKAIDFHGAESDWATLEVSMPKNKAINPFILFIDRFMERFPILEQILQPIYDKLTGF